MVRHVASLKSGQTVFMLTFSVTDDVCLGVRYNWTLARLVAVNMVYIVFLVYQFCALICFLYMLAFVFGIR